MILLVGCPSSKPPGGGDNPDCTSPPCTAQHEAPTSGGFVIYAQQVELLSVATIGGVTSYEREYSTIELDLASGRTFQLVPPFSRWSDERTPSVVAATFGARLFVGFDGIFDAGGGLSELDPATLEWARSFSGAGGASLGLLTVRGDFAYGSGPTGVFRAPLLVDGGAASLEAVPLTGGATPPACTVGDTLDGVLYCADLRTPDLGPPICNDGCATAGNGWCEDGGDGGPQTCAFGDDCGDCGPRPSTTACFDTCASANDGVCQDGSLASVSETCRPATDCGDCGPTPIANEADFPLESYDSVFYAVDLEAGVMQAVLHTEGLPGQLVDVNGDTFVFAKAPPEGRSYLDIEARRPGAEPAYLGRIRVTAEVSGPEPAYLRILDVEDHHLLVIDDVSEQLEIWDLRGSLTQPARTANLGRLNHAALLRMP